MKVKLKNVFENILIRLQLREMEVLMFLLFLPIVALGDFYGAIYVAYAVAAAMRLYQVIKKKTTFTEALIGLWIYTIMLPDNYTVLLFSFIMFLLFIIKVVIKKETAVFKQWVKKYWMVICLVAVYLAVNIALNEVPPQNLIIEVLYFSVLIALLIIYNFSSGDYTREIDRTINAIVVIQLIYTVIFIPLRFQFVRAELIGDWSVGTLGTSEGTTLFIFYVFALAKYMHQYFNTKDNYFIIFAAFSFIGAVSTVNVSLTLFLVLSVGIYGVCFMKGKKYKLYLLAASIVMITIFWNVSHPWIREQIYKTITNAEFRNNRIKKLKIYEDTFSYIPTIDKKFAAIGNGMGNYSSRAALTVSGYYVPWFSENEYVRASYYTKRFIKPDIYTHYGISQTDTPSSQYISIMGEFGYIGFFFFMFWLMRPLFRDKSVNRLSIIFLMFALLIDNYLEYYKVVLILFASYYYIKHSTVFYYEREVSAPVVQEERGKKMKLKYLLVSILVGILFSAAYITITTEKDPESGRTYIENLKKTPNLQNYFVAQGKFWSIQERGLRDELNQELTSYVPKVFKEDVVNALNGFTEMALKKDIVSYSNLVEKLIPQVTRPADRDFLYSQAYDWGEAIVYSEKVQLAVNAVNKAWGDFSTIKQAEKTAINNTAYENLWSMSYLQAQMNEMKYKKTTKNKILIIGDSIALGMGISYDGNDPQVQVENAWWQNIDQSKNEVMFLAVGGMGVLQQGLINGMASHDALGMLRYAEKISVMGKQYDRIVIALSTNDYNYSSEEYSIGLSTLMDYFKNNYKTNQYIFINFENHEDAMKSVAQKYSAKFIDVDMSKIDKFNPVIDKTHPSAEGQKQIYEAVKSAF
jgi:lysophospholipase L1-like esterase